jgi:hypothetical protein
MNRKFFVLAVVFVVALGTACVLLLQQLNSTRQREQAAAVAAQVEVEARVQNEERLHAAERDRARVEKQNTELAALTHTLRQSEAQQASNATALAQKLKSAGVRSGTEAGDPAADPSSGGGMGDMMSKMMQDPAMKEMIRSQQKSMMKTMYGALFKELNLSTDDQKKLTDLLLDSQMGGMDNLGELMGKDEAARQNAVSAMTDKNNKLKEDIKGLLGNEKFTQYENYQQTMGDRMVLDLFEKQLGDTPLRDEQSKQLLALMADERGKVPPVISEDPAKAGETFAKMASEESMKQHLKWQEDLNQRVQVRAAQVLNPAQLEEFTEFQSAQLKMQQMGLKMAKEMFGGSKDRTPPAAPQVPARPIAK